MGIEGVGTGHGDAASDCRLRSSSSSRRSTSRRTWLSSSSDLEDAPELRADAVRIVIVDDGSSDLTPTLIESYAGDLPVELLRFEREPGPRRGVPRRLRAALELAPRTRS